jgi:[protein-PII] uridylyltransferase
VSPDRPGLFAKVAGVLAIEGLEVRAADATSVDGMAIEVFQVSVALRRRWCGGTGSPARSRARSRPARHRGSPRRAHPHLRPKASRPDLPPPAVRFDDAASATATVVEVHARDRVGVLYRVLRAFAELELDVRTAKIQTLGELIVDAFYVTTADGDLSTDPKLRAELERCSLLATPWPDAVRCAHGAARR